MSGYGRTVLSAPPCVSLQAMKNGRHKADPFCRRSDIRKRTHTQFSRPMTGHTPQKLPFSRNLLHHRIAWAVSSAHDLRYITTGRPICQGFFIEKSKYFFGFMPMFKSFVRWCRSAGSNTTLPHIFKEYHRFHQFSRRNIVQKDGSAEPSFAMYLFQLCKLHSTSLIANPFYGSAVIGHFRNCPCTVTAFIVTFCIYSIEYFHI